MHLDSFFYIYNNLLNRFTMKKCLLLAFFGLGIVTSSIAQISEGGIPASFKKTPLGDINPYGGSYQVHQLLAPDLTAVYAEDAESDEKGRPYRVGINIPVSYSINNSGTWLELPNGDKIWRMGVRIPGAQALSLYFSSPVQIPDGGKLHAYNERHSQYVGAYTHNTPTFQAMELIQGDLITLEYYMPAGSTELPTIEIHEIAYYYRGVEARVAWFRDGEAISQDRAHGSCEVDAMCSESAGFTDQRNSAVHYSFVAGGTFVCSASLVNNTANDCKPYVLSANHCGDPDASSDITNHVWYFNYQRPTCVPGNTGKYTGALSQTMSGGTFRASSSLGIHPAANGSQVDGSDFVLVELNSAIPAAYNPYFAGWNRGTTAATSGKCYHHPAGDEKKISTYTTTLTNATYNGGWSGAHWAVTWAATTNGHGVTEGGSSGSPIFDQNGRIVGHLSGGSSFCSTPTASDLYGKFNKAWDTDGTTNSSQLKPWLDPGNTGVTTLNGTFSPCAPVAPVANFVASATTVTTGTTVTFTDLTSGIPTSWAWVVSPATGWAYAGGTTASSQNPQITFNTVGFYTITLTATNAQGADGETKTNYIQVTTGTPGPCVGTGTTCDEYISNVTTGSINNTTLCTNYANYSASTSVTAGSSYSYSINLGQAYVDDEVAAWIDWNADGDFIDANEQISYTLLTASTVVPITGNFTVPSGTAAGVKTMRVRISYQPDGNIDPCGTSTYGEVEDYVINVTTSGGSSAIIESGLGAISIYPNPTNGLLTVDLSKVNVDIESIELRDVTGRVIAKSASLNGNVIFNLANETAGVYFVKINTTNGSVTKKVIRM